MEADSHRQKVDNLKDVNELEERFCDYLAETFPSFLHAIKLCTIEANVKCIDVRGLNFETAHMKAIFNLLPNSQVSELLADNNNIPWGMQEFVSQLTKSTVKKLSFKNCNLEVLDVLALIEALQNMQVVDLDLSNLSFPNAYPQSSAKIFFDHLTQSRLTHLRVTASPIFSLASGENLASQLPNTSLTHIWLEHTILNSNKEVLSNLFLCLPKTVITTLHLGHNEIEDDDLKSLCNGLRQSKLEVLDLQSNRITDVGLNLLSENLVNSKVSQLILTNNKICGTNNLGKYLKATNITVLHLGRNKVTNPEIFAFPDFLKDSTVMELGLEHCELEDKVSQELVKCIEGSRLSKINLSGNCLGMSTALELVRIMQIANIVEIDLSENKCSPEILQILGEIFKSSQLHSFKLRGGSSEGGPPIAAFLNMTKSSTLKSLDISQTNFENACSLLATSLENTTFADLNLASCQIGIGVRDLALGLKQSGITHLNLSGNEIDDAGAKNLADALKNTKIHQLDMSNNCITNEGAKALVLCLKSGPLYKLNLSGNKITDDGIEELAEIIEGTFITDLDVTQNLGRKILPLTAVIWRNRLLIHKLVSFFSTIASVESGKFCFQKLLKDRTTYTQNIEKSLLFYKNIIEAPSAISALGYEENIPFAHGDIVKMVEGFPRDFVAAIQKRTKGKLTLQIKTMERAKALGLNKIVDAFLGMLAALLSTDGELMPEAFKMMVQHKESIAKMAPKPEDKQKILEKLAKCPECGLCGKSRRLTKTDCCNNWICDDEDKYVMFSYSTVSCHRNHSRYTICSFHHNEDHTGRWQDCEKCKEDISEENYADFVSNDFNFEKLQITKPTITCYNCGYQSVEMKNFCVNTSDKGWFCTKKKCRKVALPPSMW